MVAGVEENGAHAIQDGPLYPLSHLVGNLVMLHMAPPDEHIGVVQQFFGNGIHGFQSDGADLKFILQLIFQSHMDAFGIDSLHFLVVLFVIEFIVNGNLDHGVPPVLVSDDLSPS